MYLLSPRKLAHSLERADTAPPPPPPRPVTINLLLNTNPLPSQLAMLMLTNNALVILCDINCTFFYQLGKLLYHTYKKEGKQVGAKCLFPINDIGSHLHPTTLIPTYPTYSYIPHLFLQTPLIPTYPTYSLFLHTPLIPTYPTYSYIPHLFLHTPLIPTYPTYSYIPHLFRMCHL